MLDNPDARIEEWEDDIFANSLEEAEAKCQRKAENMTVSSQSLIRSLGAKQVSGKLYKCKFCSEVPDAGNS